MLKVVTSNRGVSFRNISMDIVKVAARLGIDADFIDRLITPYEAVKRRLRVVIVMCADPLTAGSWVLLARDLKRSSVPNIFYTTVEGKINNKYLSPWMRDINVVANTEYTASRLREAGFTVLDVIHHGIDIEMIEKALRYREAAVEYMRSFGVDPEKHTVVLTVSMSHPRKGFKLYDKVIEYVERRDPSIKFFIVTQSSGERYFKQHTNLVISKDFGGLPRETVLALIASSHILASPSIAEGFGLPVLEAMALGTPVVHADLPPFREFSTGFSVRVTDVVYYDRVDVTGSGFIFEHHLYEPSEFGETLLQVVDMVRNRREELENWRERSRKVAEQHSIYTLYPKLLRYVL